jgi:hypothetical protein
MNAMANISPQKIEIDICLPQSLMGLYYLAFLLKNPLSINFATRRYIGKTHISNIKSSPIDEIPDTPTYLPIATYTDISAQAIKYIVISLNVTCFLNSCLTYIDMQEKKIHKAIININNNNGLKAK